MASIKKREDGQWRARYRDDAGKEHAKYFARKVDAQRWIDETTAAVVTGQYVDPKAGKTTVRQYATMSRPRLVTGCDSPAMTGPKSSSRQSSRSRPWRLQSRRATGRFVVMLAGSGLRIGEALGLEVSDVDFLRRTVKVERQRLQSGRIGPPKTVKSARTVPLGQVVIDELAAHLSAYPSDGPLFTLTTGGPLGYGAWSAAWARAGKASSLDVDTHSLRHFYASALIAGGASVKVVQMRLGHGSAVITLNTYGHLWPGDDDLTRTVMDAAFGILADSLRTNAVAEGKGAGQRLVNTLCATPGGSSAPRARRRR